MDIIDARHLTKIYALGNLHLKVLDSVSFKVRKGEFLVVRGQSGSGKTTLLSLLSGIDKPTSGEVYIDTLEITALGEDELAPLRNQTLGFVFQSFHLVPSLTALENVMFPAELRHDREAEDKARTLLQRVGLEKRQHNFPHQLSGGEKQRVAICRALVNDPKIVFADEPTGNLDSKNGEGILRLLFEFHRERGTTIVLVTHSTAIADQADRVILLKDGRICG